MLAMMVATMADAAPSHSAPPEFELSPNCYAQERYWLSTAPVRVFSSRVGRGKTFIGVANEHVACCAVPGLKVAVTRLERASMETTTLETLRKLVNDHAPGIWQRGWSESKGILSYPRVRCDDGKLRQSQIFVFGWLDPGRQLSAEFGHILVDQAEQLDLRHYTFAQTRLRQNDPWVNERCAELGIAPRQMSLLFNPEDDEHWAAQLFRPDDGMREIRNEQDRVVAEVILSSFHDNEANLPPDYHERNESLKGTIYYDRLVLGKWARAEGMVFPMWDAARHLVAKPDSWAEWNGYPPPDWARYRGVDFGYRNPFVCLWLAEDPETRTRYVYREWSMTERLVEDHAAVIVKAEADELAALRSAPALKRDNAQLFRVFLAGLNVKASFADHDAEDAATLARHGVRTQPARKDIANCIKAIVMGLNTDRLKVIAGSVMQEDRSLSQQKQPRSLAKELSGYRYKKLAENARNPVDDQKEQPVDAANHRIDALGYVLYSLEVTPRPSIYVGAA